MVTMPYVMDAKDGRGSDLFSRLLQDRIVLLTGEINDDSAAVAVAQLLYLEAQDPEKEVSLYINSPGGSVTAGLAIVDTMRHVRCPVATTAVGLAASMGAVLLAAGEKGRRRLLPNAEVMIHQPLGGAEGQTTDVLIRARRMERMKEKLMDLMADFTGQDRARLAEDMERDYFLDAKGAVEYGLADQVLDEKEG